MNQIDIDNVYIQAATTGYVRNPIEYGYHKIFINESLGLSYRNEDGEKICIHPSNQARKFVKICEKIRVIRDSMHLFQYFENERKHSSAKTCVSKLNEQTENLLKAVREFQEELGL